MISYLGLNAFQSAIWSFDAFTLIFWATFSKIIVTLCSDIGNVESIWVIQDIKEKDFVLWLKKATFESHCVHKGMR